MNGRRSRTLSLTLCSSLTRWLYVGESAAVANAIAALFPTCATAGRQTEWLATSVSKKKETKVFLNVSYLYTLQITDQLLYPIPKLLPVLSKLAARLRTRPRCKEQSKHNTCYQTHTEQGSCPCQPALIALNPILDSPLHIL